MAMLVYMVPSEIAATVSAKVMDDDAVIAFLLQYNNRSSGKKRSTMMDTKII